MSQESQPRKHVQMNYSFPHSVFFFLFIFCGSYAWSQHSEVVSQIIDGYEEFREPSISERRIKRSDIEPLISSLGEEPSFEVQKVGESIEGRNLNLISIGTGETDILMWSQMHGDESTATMALFDLFNFFTSDSFAQDKERLLENVKLHFLPMLNPDGAEIFRRRNALGIDVNRDALRLQSPEGRTLKRIRDSLDAEFGFNLHDQSRYYNAKGTGKPATISFLAPAYDFAKSINQKRGDAMKLVVVMNQVLQEYIPGYMGRYNDDFEPRAFGDNIQKWGTRTILIESGGFPGDPEKQEIRKFNFIGLIAAIFSISEGTYKDARIPEYEEIPQNDSKLLDLKLTGLEYELLEDTYIIDLGINYIQVEAENEQGFYYRSSIADQGDLSTNYGYRTEDLSGYRIRPGDIYPEVLTGISELKELDFAKILNDGYSYVKVLEAPEDIGYTEYPVQVVRENFRVPDRLEVGSNPTFFLEKDGQLQYVVINGFLVGLGNVDDEIKNGLILK